MGVRRTCDACYPLKLGIVVMIVVVTIQKAAGEEEPETNVTTTTKAPPYNKTEVEEKLKKIGSSLTEAQENTNNVLEQAMKRLPSPSLNAPSDLKEVDIAVSHHKGSHTLGTFQPAGFTLQEKVSAEEPEAEDKITSTQTSVWSKGIGNIIMSGCYGTNYSAGDPCYSFVTANPYFCHDLLEGVMFLGVGFDTRETYTAESRRKALMVQNCQEKRGWQDKDVPDNMLADGIYEYKVDTKSFESLGSYQRELASKAGVALTSSTFSKQMQTVSAGVSGGFGPVSASVKTSFSEGSSSSNSDSSAQSTGSSSSAKTEKNTFLAVLEADVVLFEIHQDTVKPEDLRAEFVKDYMDLPVGYYAPGALRKYMDFILRWGTHYVKYAAFGGQFKMIKSKEQTGTESFSTFEKRAQREMARASATMSSMSVEASVGTPWVSVEAGYSKSNEQGSSSGEAYSNGQKELSSSYQQDSYGSTLFEIEGGSPEIAGSIFDAYSPTFKEDFSGWLMSIKDYAKPFNFKLGDITDLLNFNIQSSLGVSCAICATSPSGTCTVSSKTYTCSDIKQKDKELRKRRLSLRRAIEVYMKEGPISTSDSTIGAGKLDCEHSDTAVTKIQTRFPTMIEMKLKPKLIRIVFNMEKDIPGIGANSVHKVRFVGNSWFDMDRDNRYHDYDGITGIASNRVIVKKLSMTYDEATGKFKVAADDITASIANGLQSSDISWMSGVVVAHAEFVDPVIVLSQLSDKPKFASIPCNVHWTNSRRFDAFSGGQCIKFSASSLGNIYVILASVPTDRSTWYHIKISSHSVALYKALQLKEITAEKGAVAQGSASLIKLFFVCIRESSAMTQITYGTSSEDDSTKLQTWIFYTDAGAGKGYKYFTFGGGEYTIDLLGVRVVPQSELKFECPSGMTQDPTTGHCVKSCHASCDPAWSCHADNDNAECIKCIDKSMIRWPDNKLVCLSACPAEYTLVGKKCEAPTKKRKDCSFYPGETGMRRINVGTETAVKYANVSCDNGWTMLIRREQFGFLSFNRYWDTYKKGFGFPDGGDFYGGNILMNSITSNGVNYLLRVDLTDSNNNKKFAQYSLVRVGDESTKYALTIQGYDSSSTAGDGLTAYNGAKFSTKDQDNDQSGEGTGMGGYGDYRCSVDTFAGAGWWFKYQSGIFNHNPEECTLGVLTTTGEKIIWKDVSTPIRNVAMKIIPSLVGPPS